MMRLLFSKTEDAVYCSHLDLMRVFQRAFLRAGVPIRHSQGFNPRAYVSLALPLPVGASSVCEILDFELEGDAVGLKMLPGRLNAVLPAGIRVLQAYESERKIRRLALLQAQVRLEYDGGVPQDAQKRIAALFCREALPVHKMTKRGDAELDVIPCLKHCEIRKCGETELLLDVTVTALNPTLNPQLLVTAIETYLPELKPDFSSVCRREVFCEDGSVFR